MQVISNKTEERGNKRIIIDIFIFSAITILCGWLGVAIDNITKQQAGGGRIDGGSLGELVWLVLPLLTAFILRLLSRDFKEGGLKLNLKQSWKWYLFSIGIYPVAGILLLIVGFITKSINYKLLKLEMTASTLTIVLLQLFFMKIFEELPWRGFLAQKLISLKLNDWLIYLINGFIWSSWHYAYYMVFLPDSFFEEGGIMGGYSRFTVCVIATIIMILWSVMYVELFRLAKSVWPCLIVHVVEDILFIYILASWNSAITPGRQFLMDTNFGIVSVVILLGAGLILRSIRLKKENAEQKNKVARPC
ncbi:MAG: CPBP family intramembrane metalloprotease [Thermoclostridium sp.]|nr:CPBP family intramembrane metalloprotease [Thermoclostridium sp.]